MSAIFGIYHRDQKPVSRQEVQDMGDLMVHRGTDGANTSVDGHVGLGHRMLWTTPESLHEQLPFADQSCGLTITADARIDNREELIELLELANGSDAEISDSYLILEAYKKWGERCPEKLLGDFAFAIWDSKQEMLFCARDHFGVRPFYYYLSDKLFVFGSEIKSLLSVPQVPRRLNEVMVANFFAPTDDDHVNTCYSGIMRVPCAHSLVVSREGTRLQEYWTLDPTREIKLNSDEEYAEGLRDLFTESVRCRMRSAFPIGSTLSGGLDSSSITCVARKLRMSNGAKPWPTFSAIFDKITQCDERQFQNAVLAQGNIDPHFLNADRLSPLTGLDQLLSHQDQLFPGGNQYIIWCLCEMAKERGVRVLLEGYDGDTVISHGGAYLYELANGKRWLKLTRELRGYTKNMTGQSWPIALWHWMSRYSMASQVLKSRGLRLGRRAWRALGPNNSPTDSSSTGGWKEILDPKFVSRTGIEERRHAARKAAPKTEREDHYRKLTWSVSQDTFEMMNAIGSAFSIELRFPFYDRRLAEYCLALPPEQKMQRGLTRMVMRRAMTDIIPLEVQWRPGKSNLYDSFEQGLMNFEQERVEKMMADDLSIIEDYVDTVALREAVQRYKARKPMGSDIGSLWNVIMLTRWLQVTGLRP